MTLAPETQPDPERCPHCNADLQGDPIPEEYLDCFGGATHYSRKLAVYDYNRDRTSASAWRCPVCGQDWPA